MIEFTIAIAKEGKSWGTATKRKGHIMSIPLKCRVGHTFLTIPFRKHAYDVCMGRL